MRCPNCRSYLAQKKIRSYPVHCCMGCNGVWAPREVFVHLGNILSWDVQLPENRKVVLFKPRDIKKPEASSPVRICPQCAVSMNQFNYAYDSNIVLDRCPKCGGIWADAGEMIQVAKHLKLDMDTQIIAAALTDSPYFRQMEEDGNMLASVLETAIYVMGIL